MSGYVAFGSKFKIDGSEVANLTNISGPGTSRDTVDVSSTDMGNKFRKFKGGLIDGGEFTVEGNLTTFAASNDFYSKLEDDDPVSMEVIFPSGAKWSFDGIVTSFNTEAPFEDKLSFDATIKVDGKPTFEADTT